MLGLQRITIRSPKLKTADPQGSSTALRLGIQQAVGPLLRAVYEYPVKTRLLQEETLFQIRQMNVRRPFRLLIYFTNGLS